jgi:CheY-like chemotaxis protein
MSGIKILWADDEIDLLKPQLMFLEQKGYTVSKVTNGHDALAELESDAEIDIVFLDESMPGITGIETLEKIKQINPNIPVVMITKNETEDIMEEAIGSQIADYLIKPVNPNQILLSLKKIVDNSRLVREKTNMDYQKEFRTLLMEINEGADHNGWKDIYSRIINWEMRLDETESNEMGDILTMQKTQANSEFSRYVKNNYEDWMKKRPKDLNFSDTLFKNKIFPNIVDGRPTFVFLLDNLRYDQWKVIEPILTRNYRVEEEDYFMSILPTATQYSRNAIFSGMMPSEIARTFKQYWLNDNDEGGKNNFESELLTHQINRVVHRELRHKYFKVTNIQNAREIDDKILDYLNQDLTVIVYNFIDMMSHARTEMEVLKELAGDEKAYRSLTRSWFNNSPLWSALQKLSEKDVQVFITTDHGTIRVNQPSKVVGDRETTTNLRYKSGRNLKYDDSDVLAVRNPEDIGLPSTNISSTYIFATEDRYFLYPNNYNHYNRYYKDTFQHGGISLEEMICPIIRLRSKPGA